VRRYDRRMPTEKRLDDLVDDIVAAVADRADDRYFGALQGIAEATPTAQPEEVDAALSRLTDVLAEISFGMGADLAQITGSMVDYGRDPLVVLPILVRRATEATEQTVRFAELHTGAFGDPPRPDDTDQIGPTMDRFLAWAPGQGLSEREASLLVQAWFCATEWVQPVLYLSQRKEVRQALPERARLLAAVETTREVVETAHWLYGLLLVLDDEPLVVLHRATGRGYRVTISGIGDNFQLHTLLAAALIGDEAQGLLPGQRPNSTEIAAATDGEDVTPAGGIRGNFNLVDAYGEWIWNEGRPMDIPELAGTRVVVIDPAPYLRNWNAGRVYPMMRPELTVNEILPAEEAARWLAKVKPATRA
jgi:hypothetical protein